jgi:hypothetical protein
MGRGKVCTGFWWGNVREGDHLEERRRRWEDNIEMDLREVVLEAWSGSIWLRILTVGGLL